MPTRPPKLQERQRVVSFRVRPEPLAFEHRPREGVISHFLLIFASSPYFLAVSRAEILHENVYNIYCEHVVMKLNYKKGTQFRTIQISEPGLENI